MAEDSSAAPSDPPTSGSPRLSAFLWMFLVVVLLATVAAGTYRLARRTASGAAPLPVLSMLRPFELVDDRNRVVRSSDLTGRPWVADFIFTRCGGVCPVLSSAMQRLQDQLCDSGVRLVSFSVDPRHDQPEVLRAYAERFKARPDCWYFLTGDRDTVYKLVQESFLLVAAEAPEGTDSSELVTHSDRLVLVDERLRVRAYHRGTEPEAVEAVVADVARLAARR